MGNEVVNRKYVHTGRCHPETVVRWFLDTVHYWFDESLGPNLFTGMRDDAEKYLSTWVETGEFPPDETTLEIHTRMKFEEWLASSWRTWTPSASIPSPLIPEQTAVRAQQLFDQWLKESGLSGWLNPDFGGWKTLIDRIASELRTVTPSPSVGEATTLQQLGLEIRDINAANGWAVTKSEEFADKYKFPAVLMLIVSEVAEALEAFRESDIDHFKEEMADVLIRLLDCVVAVDPDFDATVKAKLLVNRGRGYHHGGKKRI